MKIKSTILCILLIAITIVALSLSGCTTTTTTTATPTPGTATPGADEATATPAAQTGTTTTEGINPWKQAFKFDQLNWYTYTKVGGSKVKVEYADEAYNDQPARKITTYIDDKKTQESYLDKANNEFLGGTQYLGGVEMEMTSSDFDVMSHDVYFSLDDPEDFTQGLKSSSESVTTAAGTFGSTKYITDNKYETFWVSADAPLPVKYYNSVTGYTWEPTAWG